MVRRWAFLRVLFEHFDINPRRKRMATWRFWREALERAVKTAAQGVILGLGMGEGFNLFNVDPLMALGFAGGGALLSVLTSVATVGIGAENSPSAIE
jgi:polyferredoxin